jgi:hypothetical protein
MVKKTYIPNGIWIPTHGGNLGHHELRMEEGWQELPMEPPQWKRGGRKEERDEEEREEGSGAFWCANHAMLEGAIRAV